MKQSEMFGPFVGIMEMGDLMGSAMEKSLLRAAIEVFIEEVVDEGWRTSYLALDDQALFRLFELRLYRYARNWCVTPKALSSSLRMRKLWPASHYKS